MIYLHTDWMKIKDCDEIDWHDTGNTIWIFINKDGEPIQAWAINYEPI